MKKQNKEILISCFVLFFLFLSLAFMFPYTGDDWTWGSAAGLEYLETFFSDYNGRYLGNLLVLALTRSKVLDAVVMAVSYASICYFCYEYSENKSRTQIWAAAILFFIMPKSIWAQTIVWTSGYSNYVPSSLITAAYLLCVRNTLKNESGISGRVSWKCMGMLILGISGGLFVENVTIFHIGLSACVIIYILLRFRKCDSEHICFLLGAMIAAGVMFSNSAYHKIVQGDDYYRYTPRTVLETIDMILQNARDILVYIIYDNLLFCGIATILLVALGAYRKSLQNSITKLTSVLSAVHFLSLLLVMCKDSALCVMRQWINLSARMELIFEITIALLYILSILLMVLCYMEKEQVIRMLLPLYCVAGSLLPLLVVSPIGPRCVFIGYFFMMVFAVDLAGYLEIRVIPKDNWLTKLACLIVIMQTLGFVNIFYPVHYYENLRTDFIKKQVEAGEQIVLSCELPNKEYLWNSTPIGGNLSKRYKRFHKLEENLQIEYIPLDELELMSETFR